MAGLTRELRLPRELCDAAELRFREQFRTLEELLTFMLRELLSDEAERMDEAEKRVLEKRLRDLGYV